MRIIAFLTVMAMSTTALAQTVAPLTPGKPAGVRQAQMTENEEFALIAVGAAAVAGIAVLASSGHHHAAAAAGGSTTTTTTTTSTSP